MATMRRISDKYLGLHNEVLRLVPELETIGPEWCAQEHIAFYIGTIEAIKRTTSGNAMTTLIGEVLDDVDERMAYLTPPIIKKIKSAICEICEVKQPTRADGRKRS